MCRYVLQAEEILKCGYSPDLNGEYSDAIDSYRQGYTFTFSDNFKPDPNDWVDQATSAGRRKGTDPFPNHVLDYPTRMEMLKKAQTSYLFSIIVVQWADVIICKTRVLSLFQHGMNNWVMNTGIIEETLLGLTICFSPFLQAVFGSSRVDIFDLMLALPFSLSIFLYDEIRKAIMRSTGGKQRKGFLYDYTYW